MERGRLLSLQRRITTGKIHDVIGEILAIDEELPQELLALIKESICARAIFDGETFGKLVIRTRDREIMDAPQVFPSFHVGTLCELMRARIPDKRIEAALCQRLAYDFETNSYGFRQFVLETLRDCGTIGSLDYLDAIAYDFSARHKLAETISMASPEVSPALTRDYAQHLTKTTDIFLGNLLKETIAAIRKRNDVGDDLWGLLALRGDLFDRAVKYREKANHHLDNNDIGASLNYLRKATEAMLKTVIQLMQLRLEKGDPVDKMQLPTLMAVLMDKKQVQNPDKTIHKFLENLRDISTLGSHDQGEDSDDLVGVNTARGSIETFDKTLSYFRGYVDSAMRN